MAQDPYRACTAFIRLQSSPKITSREEIDDHKIHMRQVPLCAQLKLGRFGRFNHGAICQWDGCTRPHRSEFISCDKFSTNERTNCSRVPQDRTLYSGNFTRENKSVLGVVRNRSTQTLHVLWQGLRWDATGGCSTSIIEHLALKVSLGRDRCLTQCYTEKATAARHHPE